VSEATSGVRSQEMCLVPEPLPVEGPSAERPSKYEGLVQEFWDAGYPSARVQVSWAAAAATPKAAIERAKGLAVALRKVAGRLCLPVQATVRGSEVYLVRGGAKRR